MSYFVFMLSDQKITTAFYISLKRDCFTIHTNKSTLNDVDKSKLDFLKDTFFFFPIRFTYNNTIYNLKNFSDYLHQK